MKTKDIARALEQLAPPSLAESYDNVGLLVGDPNTEVTGILVNLDVTEGLIDEAVQKGANLIVTHHPIWFTGRKRLNGEDYVSRIIIKAIKNDVGLYAIHTNLDNVRNGVNERIGQKLGVESMKVLQPKRDLLLKLEAVVPSGFADADLQALTEIVTGGIMMEEETEGNYLLETVIPGFRKSETLTILNKMAGDSELVVHFLPVKGLHGPVGSGMIGTYEAPVPKAEFLAHVKEAFGCGGIRYADAPVEMIRKVAWCGGAGSFLTGAAIRAGADAFVTGDITYHKFFDNEDRILLMDIGHYESEQFTSDLISEYLSKTFATFAVHLSETRTNPVKYF